MRKSNIAPQTKPTSLYRIFINILLLASILILLILNIAYFTKNNTHENISTQPLTSESITENTNQLLKNLYTLELHQKNYLITNNNSFTSDTDSLNSDIKNSLITLNQLTQSTSTQHQLVQSLEKTIKERMDLFSKVRTLRENDEFTNQNSFDLMHNSQLLTEEIAYTSTQLINAETHSLIEHYQQSNQDEDTTSHIMMTSSSVIILLLMLAVYLYNRELLKHTSTNKTSIDTYSELHSILECTSDMIIAIDLNLCVINFNSAYENDFQQFFTKKMTLGMNLENAYANMTEIKDKLLSFWKESLQGNVLNQTIDFVMNDEQNIYEITSNPIKNAQYEIIGAVQIIRNITQRSKDQLQLQTANEKLNAGMQDLQERNEKITLLVEMSDVSLACETLIELSEVIAKYCNRILNFTGGTLYIMHSSKNYLESTASWGNSNAQEPTFSHEACWALRLGKIHASSLNSTELLCAHIKIDQNTKCSYLCVPLIAQNDIYGLLYLELQENESNHSQLDNKNLIIKAIAELAALSLANIRLRENLRYHSIRDPLTSLYNRRYLEYFMAKEIIKYKNSKSPICLLMLDLDYFKSINDTYGHDIGDIALKEFSLVLTNSSRSNDLAVRFGGEEFVLLLCDTTLAIAKQRAEAIRTAAEKILIPYHNQQISVITVSIGIAELPEDANNFQDLIDAADKALYQAKHTGRNKTIVACNS